MGKRSTFERRERDFYPTPEAAVLPLLPHLKPGTWFNEPCVGDGALVKALENHGHFVNLQSDINGDGYHIQRIDAMDLKGNTRAHFITNPPWPALGKSGDPTISMATHLSNLAPTWLLLPADFGHNQYFAKLQRRCVKIVAVGRVKWIPDSKGPGKDNCAWYLFDIDHDGPTEFHGGRP